MQSSRIRRLHIYIILHGYYTTLVLNTPIRRRKLCNPTSSSKEAGQIRFLAAYGEVTKWPAWHRVLSNELFHTRPSASKIAYNERQYPRLSPRYQASQEKWSHIISVRRYWHVQLRTEKSFAPQYDKKRLHPARFFAALEICFWVIDRS